MFILLIMISLALVWEVRMEWDEMEMNEKNNSRILFPFFV